MKKTIWISIIVAILSTFLLACGTDNSVKVADSGVVFLDAESFESALNNGENAEGSIVTVEVVNVEPDSALGFDIWAGEHLNFVIEPNNDIETGNLVTFKCNSIKSKLGSWIIQAEVKDIVEPIEVTSAAEVTLEPTPESEEKAKDIAKAVADIDPAVEDVISENKTESVKETKAEETEKTVVKEEKKTEVESSNGTSFDKVENIVEASTSVVDDTSVSTVTEPISSAGVTDGSGDDSNFNTYDNKEQQNTAETWVLNTKSMKIHHPNCKSVPKIAPNNYGTSSSSLDELKAQGYNTCGNCF